MIMPSASYKRRLPAKVIIWLAIGLFVGLVALGAALAPPKSRSEQISEGCQREFGTEGQARVNQCRVEIMARELEQNEADKTERAAQTG